MKYKIELLTANWEIIQYLTIQNIKLFLCYIIENQMHTIIFLKKVIFAIPSFL